MFLHATLYVCKAVGGKGSGMPALGFYSVLLARGVDTAMISTQHIALLSRVIVLVCNLE